MKLSTHGKRKLGYQYLHEAIITRIGQRHDKFAKSHWSNK